MYKNVKKDIMSNQNSKIMLRIINRKKNSFRATVITDLYRDFAIAEDTSKRMYPNNNG